MAAAANAGSTAAVVPAALPTPLTGQTAAGIIRAVSLCDNSVFCAGGFEGKMSVQSVHPDNKKTENDSISFILSPHV
jgi:hypothetical protein